jgi:small-conductance mechanosensitive channel
MNAIPDLAFLVVLVFVVRFVLRLIRAYFNGVAVGRIQLQNFDRDWAMPTYKLVRLAIVAFSLVVAYPYIPGSDSLAFKGVTVFMGVILSLGSSSFIAGLVAGLTMTYRGAFKEGDLVKVGTTVGVVDAIRLMVTRLKTAKNEIVVIPNSTVLNADIVNYSQMARKNELILHTEVGIGYDTPWRQVEAMLVEAAHRTEGLLDEPAPFVLQKLLGDFAVTYELNVFCGLDRGLPRLYSQLHAHIQDVFNEHGVQIMSPAYEADPEDPKLVPPDQWYTAPAKRPPES